MPDPNIVAYTEIEAQSVSWNAPELTITLPGGQIILLCLTLPNAVGHKRPHLEIEGACEHE